MVCQLGPCYKETLEMKNVLIKKTLKQKETKFQIFVYLINLKIFLQSVSKLCNIMLTINVNYFQCLVKQLFQE